MPKAKINDINLYYEIYGKGESIIFITGFNADRTDAFNEAVRKFLS